MNLDKEHQEKLQEFSILEHNMHNIIMQKQAFQMELNETANALEETGKTGDSIYKMIGSILIKADKKTITSELEEKKRILELRYNALEKQEKLIESKLKDLQESFSKLIKDKDSK